MSADPFLRLPSFAARHACYRALAAMLRDDARVPTAVRGIRFFDAAAVVSGPSALGRLQGLRWLERPLRTIGVDVLEPGAVQHLDRIGAWLLRRNLAVARRVLLDWQELRSPLAPEGGRLSARAFDDAMVVHEQRSIDDYIARHGVPLSARRGIDAMLALACKTHWRLLAGLDGNVCAAVRGCLEAPKRAPSFFCIDTRIAIGQTLVRGLHAPVDGRSCRRSGNARSVAWP